MTRGKIPFPNGCKCLSRALRSGELGVDHRSGLKVSGDGNIWGDIEMNKLDMPIAA
jgi:hypothetical protein